MKWGKSKFDDYYNLLKFPINFCTSIVRRNFPETKASQNAETPPSPIESTLPIPDLPRIKPKQNGIDVGDGGGIDGAYRCRRLWRLWR
jgi:hypothetical protein